MKNEKIITYLTAFGLILLLLPCFVFAEGLTNPLPTKNIPELIGIIIKAVMGIVGSIALLMFIYGGFLWLTSAGNTEKIQKGKQVVVWAVIGLAIIFLSYALVNFVISGLTGGKSNETTFGTCKCQNGDSSVGMTQKECDNKASFDKTTCSWDTSTQ